MNIIVLLETPQLLVVNKPAGLAVEFQPHGYPSIEAWAHQHLGRPGKKNFIGIVHRLDRPVSGVLLLAKKPLALKDLNRQFAERTVQKTYLAIVEHKPAASEGKLEHWLEKDVQTKRAVISTKGRPNAARCALNYRTIGETNIGTLLEILPVQGKYHQIRAQLSAAGMPIVGDVRYGAKTPFLPDAIALHASVLRFKNPVDGKELEINAPWEKLAKFMD